MATQILSSAAQTQELAQKLLLGNLDSLNEKALLFALEGDLGAGKTTFTKGLGELLKVGRPIRSPGYILVAEYPYQYEGKRGKIFHIDLWRVQDETEIKTLEIPKMLETGNIIVIEWAQKVPDFIGGLCADPKIVKGLRLSFDYLKEEERKIEVNGIN